MRWLAVAAFMLVFATTSAQAQCFKDVGRKKASAFGKSGQLSTLQKQLGKSKCKVYGVRWTEVRKNGKTDKGMLVFNSRTGELVRAVYVSNKLRAESWAGVSAASLRGDSASNGIDQKHYVKIKSGTSMVVSDSSARFIRKNGMGNFLRGSLMTAGRRAPAEEEAESDVAEGETPTDSATASGDVETVAALQGDAENKSEKPGARHKACLAKVSALEGSPSPEAKASEASCEEELQIAEARVSIRKSKIERFNELLEIHLTGRLSGCLAKVNRLGKPASEKAKESSEACEKELKRRLAKASDEKIYAVLETEQDRDQRMELIWKIPNAAARERQIEREERRRERELGYVETCVKEIIDLGSKPSDAAMSDWSACRREKFTARSKARERTDEIERQIIGTRDARERRKLALEIPLKDMKQYWLNHIDREERLSASAATPAR